MSAHRRPTLLALGLLSGWLGIAAFPARADRPLSDPACAWARDWASAFRAQVGRRYANYEEQREALAREARLRTQTALQIYESFSAERFGPSQLHECLRPGAEQTSFFDTLTGIFFDRSLARLRAADLPELRGFFSLFDAHFNNFHLPLFRLTGFAEQDAVSLPRGGFHQATGAIHMSLSRIAPNEWLIVFVHELLHNLDDEGYAALARSSNAAAFAEVLEWAQRHASATELAATDRERLVAWVDAGLSRGLWAEYRTWVPTLAIYSSGLRAGLWRPIAWIEEARQAQARGSDPRRALYDYLDDHAKDPDVAAYRLPLIRHAVLERRANYRRAEVALPPLGVLEQVR